MDKPLAMSLHASKLRHDSQLHTAGALPHQELSWPEWSAQVWWVQNRQRHTSMHREGSSQAAGQHCSARDCVLANAHHMHVHEPSSCMAMHQRSIWAGCDWDAERAPHQGSSSPVWWARAWWGQAWWAPVWSWRVWWVPGWSERAWLGLHE